MKITPEQFDNALKTFKRRSLSGGQKSKMLTVIYKAHTESVQGSIVSPYMFFTSFRSLSVFAVLIFIILGTTYASAHSLPGDYLYGMKVRVLEPIVLSLQVDAEAKRQYTVSLLEKRILELETLEAEGSVGEESRQESFMATQRILISLKSAHLEVTSNVTEDDTNHVSDRLNRYNELVSPHLRLEIDLIPSPSLDKSSIIDGYIPTTTRDRDNGLNDDLSSTTTIDTEIQFETEEMPPALDLLDSAEDIPVLPMPDIDIDRL